jgi:hypothetical protein
MAVMNESERVRKGTYEGTIALSKPCGGGPALVEMDHNPFSGKTNHILPQEPLSTKGFPQQPR